MYILEQHDGYDYRRVLAVSDDRMAIGLWKEFLDGQNRFSPAKAAGQFFEVSEIPIIRTGEPPSITRAREILKLKEWE